MKYTIKIKDGFGDDKWLWRTFPNTEFVHDASVALQMSIGTTQRESSYLMQIGVSHTIEPVKEL